MHAFTQSGRKMASWPAVTADSNVSVLLCMSLTYVRMEKHNLHCIYCSAIVLTLYWYLLAISISFCSTLKTVQLLEGFSYI